jgi:hypothetical protein
MKVLLNSNQVIRGSFFISLTKMAIEKNQPAKKIPLRTVDTRDFPGEDALTNAVIEEIKIAGACIIRNLIPQRTIDKVVKDLEPHLNRKAGHYSRLTQTLLLVMCDVLTSCLKKTSNTAWVNNYLWVGGEV